MGNGGQQYEKGWISEFNLTIEERIPTTKKFLVSTRRSERRMVTGIYIITTLSGDGVPII